MYKILLVIIVVIILVIAQKKPNIVFIISDDLGWHDVGFKSGGQVITPNIDKMYNSSVNLNHYYVQAVCSPTRASIMTGRYPIRMGLQDFVIQHECPFGMNLNETILPQLLKEEGYTNHAVGKWHLGFYKWEYTPTFRYFESYLGFYTGGQYYYSHMSGPAYDFRYDKEPNCGKNCTEILYDYKNKYSTEVFSERAVNIINNHDTSKPLFLYLSYQAVHDPSEVPQKYLDMYAGKIKDNTRKRFAGMVTCMDNGIGNVTEALKAKGMLDNTLIVFTTDNGGPVWEPNCNKCGDAIGANNYPLRGGKHSLYEGGGRGVALVSGLKLPHIQYEGLMHSTDWLPTIAHIVGINLTNRTLPLDGLDQWDNIMNNKTSTRKNILHNIEMSNPEGPRASYRDGDWKIIAGPGGPPYGTIPTPNYEPCQEIKDILKSMNFKETSPLELFNVMDDPNETTNLIEKNEGMAIKLLKEIKRYHDEMMPAYNPYDKDMTSHDGWVNGTWFPWK